MNCYNEIDPQACAWLEALIAEKLIPDGKVDGRSIRDVSGNDLRGFAQCHFFAGIGGWAEALRLAGWPADRPVWTGSCPCQPFSAAGKQRGTEDERHLWPEFFRLIAECRPPAVFGEQVASALGREWLAGVRADLEGVGYEVGASDLCAAGVGAPHIRQRLYWVGVSESFGRVKARRYTARDSSPIGDKPRNWLGDASQNGWLANPDGRESGDGGLQPGRQYGQQPQDGGTGGGLADSTGERRTRERVRLREGAYGRDTGDVPETARGGATFWSRSILIPCRDGKARRIEPSIFPLAHGVQGRVGLLRGAGNAIVPQVAAEFIQAIQEAIGDDTH